MFWNGIILKVDLFFHKYFIFKEHANEDVEKMILANKCDMEEKRVISKERGESIAR